MALTSVNRFGVLVCPICDDPLSQRSDGVFCSQCVARYDNEGVIDLLTDRSLRTALEDVDYDKTAGYDDQS